MGLFDWLKGQRPSRKPSSPAKQLSDAEREQQDYLAKKHALEQILGPMNDLVGHAVLPFFLGGAVDMYPFSKAMPGTVFATMELIGWDGSGPRPNRLGTYELIACTRLQRPVSDGTGELDPASPFTRMMNRVCGILTSIGHYSQQAVLQPGETAEIPWSDGEPSVCVVFDRYDTNGIPFEVNGQRHGLLLVIQVHRSEMEYGRKRSGKALLAKLKEAGAYPYSDLGRPPVA